MINYRIPFARNTLSLGFAALLSVSGSVWSETVAIRGFSLLPGDNGLISDDPALRDGADGGSSEDVAANIISNDLSNFATAIAGTAGAGGNGGSDLARGVSGNGGNGGDGGNASASVGQLTADTALTGNVVVRVRARAGSGSSGGFSNPARAAIFGKNGNGGDGGDAIATVNVRTTKNVFVVAESRAGSGGHSADPRFLGLFKHEGTRGIAGNAGNATFGNIYGESTGGGAVSITGTVIGGSGGTVAGENAGDSGGNGGNASGATLFNKVTGNTSGGLSLAQNAVGGSGGGVTDGANTNAGIAESVLSKTTSSRKLGLSTTATGGTGGSRDFKTGTGSMGGSGRAISVGTNDAGSVTLFAKATGGQGGGGSDGANGGAGATGFTYAIGRTTGEGQDVLLSSEAIGGKGGGIQNKESSKAGDGGHATSVSIGSAIGSSRISANTLATGGAGGSVYFGMGSGGDGGASNAVLRSTITGTDKGVGVPSGLYPLNVNTTGGNGGSGSGVGESGGAGGRATGTAAIFTTVNGSNSRENYTVRVIQTGGDGGVGINGADGGSGADSVMADVFSLSTTGGVKPWQEAIGGSGGRSEGGVAGAAGFARSSLTTIARSGSISAVARGGQGGDGAKGSDAAVGGSALAQAVSFITGSGSSASATGGSGGSVAGSGTAGNGGAANLGRVFASSTSGRNIRVAASATGGSGGDATGSGNAGSGASVNLNDAVDAQSNGRMNLVQNAVGGDSGIAGDGANGVAGAASSILNKSVLNASFNLFSGSQGGSGGSRQSTAGVAANGGSADVTVNGISGIEDNVNIDANVSGSAIGGDGGVGIGGADSGSGGDASNIATVTSSGFVLSNIDHIYNLTHSTSVNGGAIGGNGGSNDKGAAGRGGNAISLSRATGTVDSHTVEDIYIEVIDTASGGNGGSVQGVALSGRGGDAQSRAEGLATNSFSGAYVNVTSTATGGSGSGNQRNGSGTAFSVATGRDGFAAANADSATANDRNYAGARANATLAGRSEGTSRSQAIAGTNEAIPDRAQASGLQSAAYATLLPSVTDAEAVMTGNVLVAGALSDKQALAVGLLGGAFSENGFSPTGATFSSSVDFNIDMDGKNNSDIVVGLLGSAVTGSHGFDSLIFNITIEDIVVESKLFSDLATAENYFSDNVLNFGLWGDLIGGDNVLDLLVSFDLTEQHLNQGFSTSFIAGAGSASVGATSQAFANTAVPVPASVWLFGSGIWGLLTIARRRA